MTRNESPVSAPEFNARCLQLIAEVKRTRRPVTITKRGRPVARLVPVEPEEQRFLGSLRTRIALVENGKRPVEPPEVWETEKEWIELCRDNPPR